uniref:Uncharacterized protein n=1 Tax=Arundo donax TaxID=35708 RepID=A0A0A9B649_ARUDO
MENHRWGRNQPLPLTLDNFVGRKDLHYA